MSEKKIRLLENSQFITHNTNANTVGELRSELVAAGKDHYSGAPAAVGGESVLDSFVIPDAQTVTDEDGNTTEMLTTVSFIPNDKTGGD